MTEVDRPGINNNNTNNASVDGNSIVNFLVFLPKSESNCQPIQNELEFLFCLYFINYFSVQFIGSSSSNTLYNTLVVLYFSYFCIHMANFCKYS